MEMDEDDWLFDERSIQECSKPYPSELKLLGLPADDTDATLSVEQLEQLARHYDDRIYALQFVWAAYRQSASSEEYSAIIRFGEIRRIIGADRIELVTADITRQWLDTWDSDVAAA